MGICSDQGIQRIGVYCNKNLVLNYNCHTFKKKEKHEPRGRKNQEMVISIQVMPLNVQTERRRAAHPFLRYSVSAIGISQSNNLL